MVGKPEVIYVSYLFILGIYSILAAVPSNKKKYCLDEFFSNVVPGGGGNVAHEGKG